MPGGFPAPACRRRGGYRASPQPAQPSSRRSVRCRGRGRTCGARVRPSAASGRALGSSFLAARRTDLPRWARVLDSDVVISRPDALGRAVRQAEEADAAIVGESWWDNEHEMNRFLAYSLLIDPVRVWRAGIEPFVDGGDPAFGLLQSAKAQGETLSEFPFAKGGYVIHRGRSSLFTVLEIRRHHASGPLVGPRPSRAALRPRRRCRS